MSLAIIIALVASASLFAVYMYFYLSPLIKDKNAVAPFSGPATASEYGLEENRRRGYHAHAQPRSQAQAQVNQTKVNNWNTARQRAQATALEVVHSDDSSHCSTSKSSYGPPSSSGHGYTYELEEAATMNRYPLVSPVSNNFNLNLNQTGTTTSRGPPLSPITPPPPAHVSRPLTSTDPDAHSPRAFGSPTPSARYYRPTRHSASENHGSPSRTGYVATRTPGAMETLTVPPFNVPGRPRSASQSSMRSSTGTGTANGYRRGNHHIPSSPHSRHSPPSLLPVPHPTTPLPFTPPPPSNPISSSNSSTAYYHRRESESNIIPGYPPLPVPAPSPTTPSLSSPYPLGSPNPNPHPNSNSNPNRTHNHNRTQSDNPTYTDPCLPHPPRQIQVQPGLSFPLPPSTFIPLNSVSDSSSAIDAASTVSGLPLPLSASTSGTTSAITRPSLNPSSSTRTITRTITSPSLNPSSSTRTITSTTSNPNIPPSPNALSPPVLSHARQPHKPAVPNSNSTIGLGPPPPPILRPLDSRFRA